jgi:hypothetical protein
VAWLFLRNHAGKDWLIDGLEDVQPEVIFAKKMQAWNFLMIPQHVWRKAIPEQVYRELQQLVSPIL